MFTNRYWFFNIGQWRFGIEKSRVGFGSTPYLDRYIAYLGRITLRLHKFWRGDDDRAPHDHPWWFLTMPLGSGYWEKVFEPGVPSPGYVEYVRPWRLHYRPATYQHIVLGNQAAYTYKSPQYGSSKVWDFGTGKPFWTLCISGGRERSWGFWPSFMKFIYYREWEEYASSSGIPRVLDHGW